MDRKNKFHRWAVPSSGGTEDQFSGLPPITRILGGNGMSASPFNVDIVQTMSALSPKLTLPTQSIKVDRIGLIGW
jgi:hypothetical protein